MTDFADRLSRRPFSLDRVVIDRTGLPGVFSFHLKLADNAIELKRGLERGDWPIFAELQRQLGLKLTAAKAPLDRIVIEHANRIPGQN